MSMDIELRLQVANDLLSAMKKAAKKNDGLVIGTLDGVLSMVDTDPVEARGAFRILKDSGKIKYVFLPGQVQAWEVVEDSPVVASDIPLRLDFCPYCKQKLTQAIPLDQRIRRD